MSLIDDGTYFHLARPAAADTAGTRIVFYRRQRWKSPPSGRDGKRDWRLRSRKPPYSWTHLKPQNQLLIKPPSRHRRRCAKRNYVRDATLVYKVYLISEQPCLFLIVPHRKTEKKKGEQNFLLCWKLRRESWVPWLEHRKRHGRFLTNGRSLGVKQTLSTRLVTT